MPKKIIKTETIETEEQSATAKLELIFSNPNVSVLKLYRRRPSNPPFSGYLTEFQQLVTEDEIKSRFGGGKFQVIAHDANSQFVAACTFEIAGKPKIESPEEDNEKQELTTNYKDIEHAYKGVFDAQNKAFESILSFFAKLNETSKDQDRAFFERMHTLTTEAHQQNLELLKASHSLEISRSQNNGVQEKVIELLETALQGVPDGEAKEPLQKMIESAINFLGPTVKNFIPFLKDIVSDETVKLLLDRIEQHQKSLPENTGHQSVDRKGKARP